MADETKVRNEQRFEKGVPSISDIFKRIVTDTEFKNLLTKSPDEALKDYQLSEAQIIMIKSLSKDDINKLTADNLEEFFAADAAVYTPDESDVIEFESYEPEDFEEIE
jgi:hypothetical protein